MGQAVAQQLNMVTTINDIKREMSPAYLHYHHDCLQQLAIIHTYGHSIQTATV